MGRFDDEWRVIYVDGEKRNATKSRMPDFAPDFVGRFFIDSPALPFRRCSQHGLSRAAAAHLEAGGRIKTSGHWYSLKPDELRPEELV